jgi:phosphatidylserine/phosphatidylglycerophosphate/cardiolipin synthase-like enzyme
VLVKPFGVSPGKTIANPMGEGRISMRSMLKLFNFKANHRKIVVTEKSLLVTSANPHSASSVHWNVALRVDDGAGVAMACESESAILKFSGAEKAGLDRRASRDLEPDNGQLGDPSLPADNLELLTEIRIKEKVLALLEEALPGARIDLCMFYLSEKDVVKAFVDAGIRGCNIRVILDPSKDAFGVEKNGVPNRQSAAKLVKAGIPLRWAETHGEQCHAKMLYVEHADQAATLLLGSCNYTRRNMNNYNAECDLAFTAPSANANMQRAREVFDRWWGNSGGRTYTTEYVTYEDSSRWRRFSAWWKETTGMGTF